MVPIVTCQSLSYSNGPNVDWLLRCRNPLSEYFSENAFSEFQSNISLPFLAPNFIPLNHSTLAKKQIRYTENHRTTDWRDGPKIQTTQKPFNIRAEGANVDWLLRCRNESVVGIFFRQRAQNSENAFPEFQRNVQWLKEMCCLNLF